MHFIQLAVILSAVIALDASPVPNNAVARSFQNSSDIASFYGSAAFDKRQSQDLLNRKAQAKNDAASDNSVEVAATSVSLAILYSSKTQDQKQLADPNFRVGRRSQVERESRAG
jgi:hypothetical protein